MDAQHTPPTRADHPRTNDGEQSCEASTDPRGGVPEASPCTVAHSDPAQAAKAEPDKPSQLGDGDEKPASLVRWRVALFASLAIGAIAAAVLKAFAPEHVSFIATLGGYIAGIVAIGTSNLFTANRSNHYGPATLRVVACAAALCLGASAVLLFP